jgi:hypothetical protein
LSADGDGGGFAFGDEADAQSAEARKRDSEAIVCGEAFEFQAVALAVGAGLAIVFRKELKLAVGEHSVDIEYEDFDTPGAVLCGKGHVSMIAWRAA